RRQAPNFFEHFIERQDFTIYRREVHRRDLAKCPHFDGEVQSSTHSLHLRTHFPKARAGATIRVSRQEAFHVFSGEAFRGDTTLE
ncbi:hypothetical protein SB816_30020, partial [Achromobacter sp. SIMBA_011]|uniref:hypothetical protein n=1 Tax=Achromobacter sp. SIMBA_011 TaxID=3085759 RepID=UPI0039799E70